MRAVGDFNGFGETEAADPEGNLRFDFADEQDRGDSFYVHGVFLLRFGDLSRRKTQKQS